MPGFVIFTSKKIWQGSNAMRNGYLLVFFAAYFVCSIFPANACAATVNASSCSLAHVQAAVTSASRGDTVTVPAGKCTWGATLNITKAITLQGAGAGNTVITSNIAPSQYIGSSGFPTWLGSNNYMIYFKSTSVIDDYDKLIRITGFTFDSNDKSGLIYMESPSTSTAFQKVRIDHNTLITHYNTLASYLETLALYGMFYGVFDNNTVSGSPEFWMSGRGKNAWVNFTSPNGSGNAFFVEDNIINITSGGANSGSFAVSVGEGMAGVFRYNTINKQIQKGAGGSYTHAGINCHGNAKVYSAMMCEYYGNKVIDSYKNDLNIQSTRGGQSMVFYNKYVATKAGGQVRETETYSVGSGADTNAPTPYSCPSDGYHLYPTSATGVNSCGKGPTYQPQHVWRTYIFNNRVAADAGSAGNFISTSNSSVNSPEQQLRENVDYFVHNTSCSGSSCTSGVGCGPTLPTSCTTGTGYWLTSQSCSAVPNESVGRNPESPLSGTLYRCVSANNWKAYYAPYQYPHPLRSEDPESISSPKGFKVVSVYPETPGFSTKPSLVAGVGKSAEWSSYLESGCQLCALCRGFTTTQLSCERLCVDHYYRSG